MIALTPRNILASFASPFRHSKLERAQVDLVLAAPPLVLQSAKCWLLGMIVYELITNAARHAFHGRYGEIRVELLRVGAFVHCKVLDNGSAPAHVHRGHGLKIIGELVKALDGRFKQKFGTEGSTSILVFPYNKEPWRKQPTRRSNVEL